MAKYTIVSYVYSDDFQKSEYYHKWNLCLDIYHSIVMKQNLQGFLRMDNPPIFVTVRDDLLNIFSRLIEDGIINFKDVELVFFDEEHKKRISGYTSRGKF